MMKNAIIQLAKQNILCSFKGLLLMLAILLLTSCASFIPTSGPSRVAIADYAQQLENKTLLIDVDNQLIRRITKQPRLFSDIWQAKAHNGALGIGDVVTVTIWESPPAILFLGPVDQTGSGTAHVTELPQQMIDQTGSIRIPFVGFVMAQGKTPSQLGIDIGKALTGKANQPQVLVSLVSNFSTEVTVIRDGKSICMPLTTRGERILDALAVIGGPTDLVHQTSLQLTRGEQVAALPLTQIINNPSQNILLQGGDIVSILNQPLSFVILGATGKNQEMAFENEGITLAQALGRTGGLNDNRANAQGIFIFRYESPENLAYVHFDAENKPLKIADRQPVVYRIDLSNPDGFFHMQDFMLQDKDILYVANAPATEMQKFLRAVLGWLSPAMSVTSAANNM